MRNGGIELAIAAVKQVIDMFQKEVQYPCRIIVVVHGTLDCISEFYYGHCH